MLKITDKKILIRDQGLYSQFLLASIFMFIIPLLLALYVIVNIILRQDMNALSGYARLIILWMVVSGVFGFSLAKRPILSILDLIKKAKEISDGNMCGTIVTEHRDELKDLATAFNRLTADLEKKIAELEYSRSLTRELFQKIGHAITSSQKIDALLTLIVQSVRKVLRGEASFVATYEPNTTRLYLKAYSGTQKDLSQGIELPDKKGAIGFVIKNKKPMIIKKGGDEASLFVPSSEEYLRYTTILCVPIIEKDIVKGVVGVSDLMNTEKIDTDDLFLMENIASQIATSIENFTLNRNIEETYYQTLLMLARVVEAKDAYSAGHLERVSKYVAKMADKLRLDLETKKVLTGGAILHDLGKVGIQDNILKKEDRFTKEEYEVMKQHAVIGENILKPLRSMSKLSDLVRHHHELYDGTGYPDGLRGEDIPLSARILAIADVYDAISTDRPYRKAMTRGEAIKTLESYAGNRLDPKLVEVFIGTLGE